MSASRVPATTLLDVPVRLHAELGRARMPLARAIGLGAGTIIDLDRAPEEPVDVFVNGRRFGTARLVVVDGEWAVRLESLDVDALAPRERHAAIEPSSSPAQSS